MHMCNVCAFLKKSISICDTAYLPFRKQCYSAWEKLLLSGPAAWQGGVRQRRASYNLEYGIKWLCWCLLRYNQQYTGLSCLDHTVCVCVFGDHTSIQMWARRARRRSLFKLGGSKYFLLGLRGDLLMGGSRLLRLGRWCLIGIVVGDLVFQLIVGQEVQGSSLHLKLASAWATGGEADGAAAPAGGRGARGVWSEARRTRAAQSRTQRRTGAVTASSSQRVLKGGAHIYHRGDICKWFTLWNQWMIIKLATMFCDKALTYFFLNIWHNIH